MADYRLQQTGEVIQERLNQIPLNTDGIQILDNEKVDKVPGKGLSENDFTNEEKFKLNNMPANPAPQDTTYTKAQVDDLIANFITKSVNDLVNYYLKSDTYTKAEVQTLINAVKQFTYESVQTLPTASAATMNKIYLVPSTNPKTQNVKDEFITVVTVDQGMTTYSWEQIGSTAIDLSGYYTSAQTDAAITAALNAALASYSTTTQMNSAIATAIANYYTKAQVDDLIANFITKSVNDLANYYLKSDTYTKAEVQTLINAVKQFTYVSVAELPTASAETMNKIYLVPSSNPETQNVKDEYITIMAVDQGLTTYSWEQIGSTAIDLSGYYTSAQTDAAITAALNAALASYSTTTQMNSAIVAEKAEIIGGASTDCDTLGKAEVKISTNAHDIAQLQAAYEVLTQSTPVIVEPTDTWPVATPEEGVIYRVIDRVNTPPQNYSDYMYNGTAMVLMATYDNAIDDVPTPGSNNLVKSGGVASHIVYDISEANAVGSTLATYANLAAALGADGANVHQSIRKGGMSVKFIQSSDNKYVQYRLINQSFTTDITQWQGVDEAPLLGSQNLVESNGVSEVFTSKGLSEMTFNVKGGINGSDGSDSPHDAFVRTGYVPVSQGMKLTYDVNVGSTGWCAIACYDSDGDYMSSASVKGTSSEVFVVPSGVSKIRLSTLASYTDAYAKFQFVSEYTKDYPDVITLKITDKAVTHPKLGDDVNAYLNRLLELNLDGGVSYANGDIGTGTATNHKMTGYIKVIEGEKINYDLLGLSTGWAIVAAYSESFEYLKTLSIAGNASITTPTIGQYVVPNGVAYIILSGASNYNNTISFDTFETSRVLGIVNEKISEFDGYLDFKNIGGINADGTDSPNINFKRTDLISVNTGDIIKASVQEGSDGWCAIACYDSSQVFVSDETILGTGQVQNILKTIPDGVSYIKISTMISYSGGYAIKNRVVRENELKTETELTRVNTISVMKYPNILQQRGCIAIQMDLSYLDNARSGCDSMLEVMREYGLMSMDYAINITALQDAEIDKLLCRQKEGCEIIYHNRINSPSDFSNNSTLTVAELKEGVLDERLAMTQKGFTTFGVVANVGSLATRYKPTIDNIFFWSEYGSKEILTEGAENTKTQYLSDHRIIRTAFDMKHSQHTPELEAEMIAKGKAWIDDLCTNKTMGVMYCHFYDRTTDVYHLYEGVLRAMCEYIAEKIIDGELWYGRTTECLNYLCR